MENTVVKNLMMFFVLEILNPADPQTLQVANGKGFSTGHQLAERLSLLETLFFRHEIIILEIIRF